MARYRVKLYGSMQFRATMEIEAPDALTANRDAVYHAKYNRLAWEQLSTQADDVQADPDGPELLSRDRIEELPTTEQVEAMEVAELMSLMLRLQSPDLDLGLHAAMRVNRFLADVAVRMTREHRDLLASGRVGTA